MKLNKMTLCVAVGVFSVSVAIYTLPRANADTKSHFQIGSLPDPEITLVRFDPSVHNVFDKLLQKKPDLAKVAPYAMVLTNNSTQPISYLSVVWDVTGADGIHRKSTDRFLSTYGSSNTVVGRGSQSLLLPATAIDARIADSGYLSSRPSPQLIDRLYLSSSVKADLDVVIFANGLVIGPDNSGTVVSVKTRKEAATNLVRDLRDLTSKGGDVPKWLAERAKSIALENETPWMSRYAQTLQRNYSKDGWPRAIAMLEGLPEVPLFFRKQ